LNASGARVERQRPIGAAVVCACGSVSPPKNMREVAIGKVKAQHRAAENNDRWFG
jgi:hypothetical protein